MKEIRAFDHVNLHNFHTEPVIRLVYGEISLPFVRLGYIPQYWQINWTLLPFIHTLGLPFCWHVSLQHTWYFAGEISSYKKLLFWASINPSGFWYLLYESCEVSLAWYLKLLGNTSSRNPCLCSDIFRKWRQCLLLFRLNFCKNYPSLYDEFADKIFCYLLCWRMSVASVGCTSG